MSKSFSEESFAENLERLLVPVQPTDVFRDRLRHGLQLAGNQQRARRVMQRKRAAPFHYWWMGAAAFGVSLAAGSLIALRVRSRFIRSHST